MRKAERDALRLAMKIARNDPGRAAQLDAKLKDGESWQAVAEFAASCCQGRTLRLKVWQCPPADMDDDIREPDGISYGQRLEEIALLKRLQRAGVSKWHPDPMKALAEAEAERAAKSALPPAAA